MNKEEILRKITDKYLGSEEFNGCPLYELENEKQIIVELLNEGKIDINFGDLHPNIHIKAFELGDKKSQVDKINVLGLKNSCAYPTKEHLKSAVNPTNFGEKPFTLKIAYGEPTLNFAVFDLSVLEAYRNDPRYFYSTNDIEGNISISDISYQSLEFKESDKILLESFGFGYEKDNMHRVVAVFYCYLSKLTAEHQKIWQSKLLQGNYFLHPDYLRTSMGNWSEKMSIFDAFIEEIYTINEFSKLMNRSTFFNETFKINKPKEFSFLIRPTLKEFNGFVHLLDKMISDNINKEFFKKDIKTEIEEKRKDGKIMVKPKGTITILEEWLNSKIKLLDPKPKERMIKIFRDIRSKRMKPAHTVEEDKFDQKYFKNQRELIIEAYNALRTLRLIFANHKNTKAYKVPDWLYHGDIWSF